VKPNRPDSRLSDASRTVVSVGSRVTRFKVGDHVLSLFRQGHLSCSLDAVSLAIGLGGQTDGVLRTYAVFPNPASLLVRQI
jgi:NADPH:quinone reductase-like Zn-dependent oxidoreductase